MATQTVNFNNNYSDAFQVTGTSLVIRVESTNGGGIILERSITGDKYVSEAVINPIYQERTIIEQGISGCVPGQWLRLRLNKCTPTLITVLQ